MAYKNIEDQRKAEKRYYQKHKEKVKERSKLRKQETKNEYNEYKNNLKCEVCGENFIYCLEFHHIDPNEKEYSVSNMSRSGYSMKKILIEINKCRVLCANCHRKIHYGILV